METELTKRRYDLDWLRVIVILMLIPFHAAVMFDAGSVFHVKNSVGSAGLAMFTDSLGSWGMELLFFVAGASSWFALCKYRWHTFLRERMLRLLLPLIVGTLTLAPVMGYFGYMFHTGERLAFLRYYPKFFTLDASRLDGVTGTFSPAHLWFILFLLVLILVALPVFLLLNSRRGERVTARLAAFFAKPGTFMLMPVILLLLEGLPELAERNVARFFIFLIAGFIWVAHLRLQESADRQRYWLLAVAVIVAAVYLPLQFWGENQPGFTLGSTFFDFLHDTYAWTAVLALVAFARRYLNRPSQSIRYLGRASYVLYIIHLPIVIAIGYFIVQWQTGIAVKFSAITLGSCIATLGVYELLFRRVALIGWLFGMKADNTKTPLTTEKTPVT